MRSRSKNNRAFRIPRRGFTLAEVLVAAGVMAVGLTAGITCLNLGIRSWETTRANRVVTQVLEDEAERLRLLDYAELSALPSEALISLPPHFSSPQVESWGLELRRTLSDVSGYANFKQVDLVARWEDRQGRSHRRHLIMRAAKHGVYDQ